MSEWSNKTVYGLFQYTSSTDSVSEWSNKTVCGLFQYTSSTACQNGVTRLFMDCSSILVVQRVRMEYCLWIVPVLVVQRVRME